jgi:hypothetical protein
MSAGPRASRLARPYVALLLAVFVLTPLLRWEPWPFTSWRLFSGLRYDEQSGWQAVTVDRVGREAGYPLQALPRGFRGFNFVMTEFAAASRARRDELCRTWVEASPELVDRDARAVRIYRLEWQLSERVDGRAAEPSRTLAYTCTREGVG